MTEECVLVCPQCPKVFATRSNLKRHMENSNIHNVPFARSRDQKRWKNHSKKGSSREETTERMRRWRADNRDKNKRNDLRCRVYRLARQRYGPEDSEEKEQFINAEIHKRLDRRMLLVEEEGGPTEKSSSLSPSPTTETTSTVPPTIEKEETIQELPFYCAPLHKIELPSLNSPSPSKQYDLNNTFTSQPSVQSLLPKLR